MSGSLGGGVIGRVGTTLAGGVGACSIVASIEAVIGILSFLLHQLFFTEFLPGTDITEPVGDIGGGLLSLS